MGEFVILRNGKIETYTHYDDIPESFDHVIKFLPAEITGPHTHEEHDELSIWNDKLKELMKRETK